MRRSGGKKTAHMQCNICQSDRWRDFAGRNDAACAECGSLERTRLVYLHLQKLQRPQKGDRILHIAVDPGLTQALRKIAGEGYQAVNYFPDGVSPRPKIKHFDLCVDAAKLEDESFDLIIHNHVLEHILCDVTSVMMHLLRALRPNGRQIFSAPFLHSQHFEEYLGPLPEAEAVRRFGQKDHCRNFGVADLAKTFGLFLDVDFDAFAPGRCFTDAELDAINFPKGDAARMTIGPGTVFVLEKSDCVFLR